MELRHSRHSVSALQYHFVFCPKYRKPLLSPGVDIRLKLIIIDLAEFHNWDVQSLEVMPDHVHMLIADSHDNLDETVSCLIEEAMKRFDETDKIADLSKLINRYIDENNTLKFKTNLQKERIETLEDKLRTMDADGNP